MPDTEIQKLKSLFVENLAPVRIYLFGSYAAGTAREDSDLDFYIMLDDDAENLADETAKAYKAIRSAKEHPVDIVVGTRSRFEKRRNVPSIENEVSNKGVLLYER